MFLLVADDLTGGNDAGIQFAKRGVDTWIVLDAGHAGLEAVLARPKLPAMLALNANTRNLPAVDAAARMTKIASHLAKDVRTAHPEMVYKKIDSTLRGNLGAEIDALMDGYGFATAFLSPAFIECGRTVVDGHLLVDGAPVHKTSFANDPITPVRQSSIAEVVRETCGRSVGCVPLSVMEHGEGFITAYVADLQNAGHEIIVFDAVNATHLDALVAAGQKFEFPPLYIGSAGLASALANALTSALADAQTGIEPGASSSSQSPADTHAPVVEPVDRVFFICGSAHEATRKQIARLVGNGVQLIRLVDAGTEAVETAVADTLLALESGNAVLSTPEKKAGGADSTAASGIQLSNAVGLAAVTVLEKLAESPQTTALVMTGGETAFAVLQKICSGLALSREISPGVALGTIFGGYCDGFQVVTKAGGFGEDQTLVDILRLFRPKNCR